MFDGVQDQYHQFIASRSSLPIPLSFPLHGSTAYPSFDPYPSSHDDQTLLHNLPPTKKVDDQQGENSLISTNLELERQRSALSETVDLWSNDEVLALLRIRSSVENWFPDLIWEHVSRKLADLGFKRSAEKCKQKFDEETRTFNTINTFNNKSNRFFSELEELYHGDDHQNNQSITQNPDVVDQEYERNTANMKDPSKENEGTANKKTMSKSKKRKRERVKFEMFKGFCFEIVNKMMAQQEELHNKLLEDMASRDEEKIARQEEWKKKEMERMNKETEIRAREQAVAGDRQATIIDILKKFTSIDSLESQLCSGSLRFEDLLKIPKSLTSLTTTSPSSLSTQSKDEAISSLCETLEPTNPSSTLPKKIIPKRLPLPTQNSNSPNVEKNQFTAPRCIDSTNKEGEDIGKRWPRDEVLALINIRSSLNSGSIINQEKEGGGKCSLWERISQGMSELGYKRSAKRCKEKWENINKYFRKTKDANKKRSVDSRTCPYFHQLSSLYNHDTSVMGPQDVPENSPAVGMPENRSALLENRTAQGGSSDSNMNVVDEGKNVIQVPGFNFEF
ncbi:hypothetical protein LguiB_010703 [Lonicera macranthoides]